MSDFECHPKGTAARIAALEAENERLQSESQRWKRFYSAQQWNPFDEDGQRDQIKELQAQLATARAKAEQFAAALTPEVIDLVRCGIGANYGGSLYEDALRRLRDPLVAAMDLARQRARPEGETFQQRVQPWLMECFGEMIAGDREERNHRFLEEALELVQACGCSRSEAHQLVDYVFDRPVGEPHQEVGGVMVTLAALCLANDLNMHGATEYKRLAETDDRFAMECAEATLGALDDGLLADPEEAAREDMSYWSD
ncbi:MAG TPA: hypothetical protein VIG24_07805 [Acidimicrobiia bacterium]